MVLARRDLGDHFESYNLKTGPFGFNTFSHDLDTGPVEYSDVHCTVGI
jgi:hypothetical protein